MEMHIESSGFAKSLHCRISGLLVRKTRFLVRKTRNWTVSKYRASPRNSKINRSILKYNQGAINKNIQCSSGMSFTCKIWNAIGITSALPHGKMMSPVLFVFGLSACVFVLWRCVSVIFCMAFSQPYAAILKLAFGKSTAFLLSNPHNALFHKYKNMLSWMVFTACFLFPSFINSQILSNSD